MRKTKIERTIRKIVEVKDNDNRESDEKDKNEEKEEKLIFIQYRGKITEKFEQSLRRIQAPCKVITTTKKLKTASFLH